MSATWEVLEGAVLRYRLELPQKTPSNNEIRGMNRFAYQGLRRDWQLRVFTALKGRRPKEPLTKAFLRITRGSSSELDWDNAYGGLKPLLDCLVMPSKRNPDGLGLIQDDSPSHMPLPPLVIQVKAKPEDSSTVVEIFELTAA